MPRFAQSLVLLLLPGAPFACLAQTAQITGRVTDSSQAAVATAAIQVLNTETGVLRNASSNELGYYTVAALPNGPYELTVTNAGFKTIKQKSISLNEGQVLRLDFQMEVGTVSEAIDVVAQSSLIETATTAISTVVTNQRILDLPMAGRNPFALVSLVPGVRGLGDYTALPTSSYGGSRASINGAPPSTNSYMVDGTAAEFFTSGSFMTFFSVDATEEFRIVTSNPSAEYGRTSGAIINVISKSGTNTYHGTLYEFLRNRELNANSFFGNRTGTAKSPFVFNEYGGTVGGPVVRNRTFFFFNWEEFKQRTQSQTFRTVPTDAMRTGDFSDARSASGQLVQIYDPYSTRLASDGSGNRVRDAFPGNIIPKSRLSPVALAAMKYYPEPNQPGVLYTHNNNFFGQGSSPLDKRIIGVKMDHNFSETRRLSGRFTYDKTFSGIPNFYQNIAETQTSDLTYQRRSAMVNYLQSFSPTFLMEARAGFNRYAPNRIARSYGFDMTSLGLPGSLNSQVQLPIMPMFNTSDVSQLGGNQTDQLVQAGEAWTGVVAFSRFHRGHDLKFGFEQRLYRYNNSQGGPVLQFDFNRSFTQGPNPNVSSSAAGYGFATMLLGTPTSGSAVRYPTATMQTRYSALYLQDDWKVSPKLTLNLGLRWEYEGAPTDRYNALTNFDPSLTTTANGVTLAGGLRFPGYGSTARSMRDNTYLDFGPRVGFAYQAMPKTVLRGGYGIYQLPGTGIQITPGRTGYEMTSSMVTSVDGGFTPYNTLANPFPTGITQPTGSSLGALTGLGTSVSGNLRTLKRGYMEQWNMNIQRELPGNWLVEVGYAGNRGLKMPAMRSYDYLPAAKRALGTQLQDQVANPYYGLITSGTLSTATVTRSNLLDTYPQFLGASGLDSYATSIYHSLVVRVEKRFSRGFSVLVSYTNSKLLDNTLGNGNNNDFTAGGSNSVQNWDDLRSERAISTIDKPQRLVTSTSWALPIGKSGHRVYRAIAGDWQVNSILTLTSGDPIAITASAPAFGGSRPNIVGDPNSVSPTIDRWFNTSAFALIAPFTFGNGPRNLPATRTDGLFNWDFSLMKDMHVTERVRLHFRSEFFNFTNTPTFGAPGSTVGSGSFGVVSSTASSPRQIQLGLKLYF